MPDDQSKQEPQEQQDPEAPDLEQLAHRYVDLWQDQMTAMAGDPEFAESLQRVMAGLGLAASGAPATWAGWPAALGSLMAAARPYVERGQQNDATRSAAAPGATSAAAASARSGPDVVELADRLAALEQRIAALERTGADGGTGRTRRRAKEKTRRD